MATKRDGLPAFWSTHLAKVLVGDQPCLLAPWLSGHFTLDKAQRDQSSLAVWKANHSAQLAQAMERYRAAGATCDVERYFKVTGQTAILSGKVDLVVQQTDKRPLIVDVKSGKPKDSDVAQVMIEIIAVPLAWESRMTFDGLVIYADHVVNIPNAEALELRPRLFELLKKLGTMSRPTASPSESACWFCEVGDLECPDRWKTSAGAAQATTALF